jgi:RHS repeat-associated protein
MGLPKGLTNSTLMPRLLTTPLFIAMVLLVNLSVIGTAHAVTTATRASAFEYDPVSGLLTKEIIEPDNSDLCLVTTYTYDSFGNKTGATTRNCNGSAGSNPGTNTEAAAPAAGAVSEIVARTSSTTYDSKGQYPISSTNALNQTETKTYNADFGTVATLVGPNALTTSWTYDSFGKPLTEARADGTSTSTAYALCTTGCPTVGTAVAQYTITVTQAGAPYSKNYYDMEGRAIQSETQDKDGALILTQVQFDNLGRTYKTSRPFKTGVTPVWNTVAYDKLNRPVSNTAPNNTVTNITYNGYTTIATNALSQTKTEIKNSQGQLVTVTDTQAKSLTYQYDAFGNLTKTTDVLGNMTSITYDTRGRKTGMDDPDQGVWSYQYDALGQLKKQTDAKLQNVTFTYDKLGRMLTRNEPDLISTWTYDTCDATLNPGGKCIGKPIKESTDNGYVRTYLYDAYGRHTAELDNVDTGYGVTKSFDSYGRVSTLVYPSGNGISFSTQNVYSSTGHLSEVREVGSNALFWQAGSTDNEGRITTTTYGNTVTNTTVFDALTGRITQVSAGTSNSVSNQSFVYDNLGNLTQRYDQVTNLNEGFGYDSLNRLTSTSAQAGTGPLTQTTVTYNAIGNIMTKSDIGTYTYASLKANGSARPHAVSQIMMNDGTTIYGSYTYDANGNQTGGAGRTIIWNSFNMPNQVIGTKPAGTNPNLPQNTPVGTTSSTFAFVYNATHERVKETLPDGTIVYNVSPRVDTGIHVEKRVSLSGAISYNYSMYAGSLPFGVHTVTKATPASTAVITNRYYHTDHLGSIIAITDDTGTVVERRSYDAWGKRRNQNGTSLANAFVTSDIRYAFGGHEDLGEVGLIHMNGRLYDPATGRFISADPTIQTPDDMQNYNRYSYINNNPLSGIDYSGYGLFSFVGHIFKAVTHVIGAVLHNSFIRTVASIAIAVYAPEFIGSTNLFGGALYDYANIIAGAASSLVGSGGDLRAAITGAITAGAFNVAGDITNTFGNIAAHAAIGCASAVAGGGKCGSGALSAGFADVAAPFASGFGRVGGTIISSIVGGTASVLGGGKFENGAVTGAFGYLFNCWDHPETCTPQREAQEHKLIVESGAMDMFTAIPIVGGLAPIAERGVVVTEEMVAKALATDSYKTTNAAVSLPMIQRYVDMIYAGTIAPAIKVFEDIIVDGNHRYIAGKITGKMPQIDSGTLSASQAARAQPISSVKISPKDFSQ